MIDLGLQRHAGLALASAALFGASTPLAKLLLGQATPQVLAGLLYLGSGLGLLALRLGLRLAGAGRSPVVGLARADWPWLAGAVLCGGVLAPVALLWGLAGQPASAAALLLNAEPVLSILVAAALFGEHVGKRVWIAAAVMLAGGLALAWEPGAAVPLSPRAGAVVGACLLWALDNNLTGRIAAADAGAIATIKGLVAGTANVALGLGLGGTLPGAALVAPALLLGAVSYGVSLVLFIAALRHLGAARTSAHFATSPFLGAALALLLLREPVGPLFAGALVLMAAATWILVTERHGHAHRHERLEHSHRHVTDAHHRHAHDGSEGPEPHAHAHVHEPLTHAHPHLPDLHHRHPH